MVFGNQMSEDTSFVEMKGALGSLLLLWSAVERAARAEVARLHGGVAPKSAHGIASVLNAWEAAIVAMKPSEPFRVQLAATLRTALQEPLNIRNGVCHGLIGISSAYDGKPAVLTWELNGETRSITWTELQIMFSWLSKVQFAIPMIVSMPSTGLGNRMTNTAENRQWWLDEYGIALCG